MDFSRVVSGYRLERLASGHVLYGLLEKEMVTHWQLAFSMRELVRTNRISGLAYEPAWLAGQLATIFIPLPVCRHPDELPPHR
jgi:hypothetical protein